MCYFSEEKIEKIVEKVLKFFAENFEEKCENFWESQKNENAVTPLIFNGNREKLKISTKKSSRKKHKKWSNFASQTFTKKIRSGIEKRTQNFENVWKF